MGDHQGGRIFHQLGDGIADLSIGCEIEMCRRLVEDQETGFPQQCPGDADSLLLTRRELLSSFADDRLQTGRIGAQCCR